MYNLTFAKTSDVASFSKAILISTQSFTKSGSISTSPSSVSFLPIVRQETVSNTSNAQPLRAKNRSCAMLDIFLSASYTPSSCSIFSIGGRLWCRLNQKVVFHGLPEAISQDSLPSCLRAARLTHDCGAVGPAFQNYHQSSRGTPLLSLLKKGLLTWREPRLLFEGFEQQEYTPTILVFRAVVNILSPKPQLECHSHKNPASRATLQNNFVICKISGVHLLSVPCWSYFIFKLAELQCLTPEVLTPTGHYFTKKYA